jgi:hypothetical protein
MSDTLQQRIIQKATRDGEFRRLLHADPHAAIKNELGIEVPSGKKIVILEESPQTLYVVLPAAAAAAGELTDAELEIAGGAATTGFSLSPVNCGANP